MSEKRKSRGHVGRFGPDECLSDADDRISDALGRKIGSGLTSLVLKLERMAAGEVEPMQRIALLRAVEPQVAQAVATLPEPVAAARQAGEPPPSGLLVEQRLYCLAAKNLQLAIEGLDRSSHAFGEDAAVKRWWLVRTLLRFLGRQVELCVALDLPWTPLLWSRLHDLFAYLLRREDIRLGRDDEPSEGVFDPELEYKRLLLLGLYQRLAPGSGSLPLLLRVLPAWARECRLLHPAVFGGAFGFYAVELSRDEPPREQSAALEPGFNGWVFEPPQAFFDFASERRAAL